MTNKSRRIFQPAFEVRETGTLKGRGVFALKDFRKNQIVEVCPVVLIEDYFSLTPDCIQDIVFDGTGMRELSKEGKEANKDLLALVLGYGSMYNHGSPSNIVVIDDPSNQTLVYKARRTIRSGEEMLINYDDLRAGMDDTGKWLGARDITIE